MQDHANVRLVSAFISAAHTKTAERSVMIPHQQVKILNPELLGLCGKQSLSKVTYAEDAAVLNSGVQRLGL
jgi:hypothetical protein